MNAIELSMTIILIILLNSVETKTFKRCDQVPTHIGKLYRRLTINRKHSGLKQLPTTGIVWRNSSLRMYFNMSSLSTRTQIFSAELLLYRGQDSFPQTLIYQQSLGLIIKDINTENVLYNRTIASSDRFCLVKNVLSLVQRWQRFPESNQGLLLAVKDRGKYSTTVETFYPKKNIYVPALALFLNPGKIFLKRYRLIPSQVIEILNAKT